MHPLLLTLFSLPFLLSFSAPFASPFPSPSASPSSSPLLLTDYDIPGARAPPSPCEQAASFMVAHTIIFFTFLFCFWFFCCVSFCTLDQSACRVCPFGPSLVSVSVCNPVSVPRRSLSLSLLLSLSLCPSGYLATVRISPGGGGQSLNALKMQTKTTQQQQQEQHRRQQQHKQQQLSVEDNSQKTHAYFFICIFFFIIYLILLFNTILTALFPFVCL